MTVYGYGGSVVFAANDSDGEEWTRGLDTATTTVRINDISYHPDGDEVMVATDNGLYKLDPASGDGSTIRSDEYDQIVCGPSNVYAVRNGNTAQLDYFGTRDWLNTNTDANDSFRRTLVGLKRTRRGTCRRGRPVSDEPSWG